MSEIIEEEMLVKVSATANNNKFYHVVLDSNGTIIKRWGRVGTDGVSSSESGSSARFQSVVNAKKKRGYVSTGIVSTQSKASGEKVELEAVAKKVLTSKRGNVEIDRLIETLVSINAHQIIESSGGLIKVNDSGVISTPLGILNNTSLQEAEKILNSIKAPSTVPMDKVEKYLQLVPQTVPRQRGWGADFFTTHTTVPQQKEFLKQLSESLKWYEEEAKAQKAAVSSDEQEIDLEVKYAKLFRSKIDILDSNSLEFKKIQKYYESSKNAQHGYSVNQLKLKRVFTLTDEDGQETYDKVLSEIGNERQLWHGTRAFNVLSILRKGLFVPPLNGSIQTVGRMFGPGVYFSPQSSKSANYARGGVWSSGPTQDNCFMFLANVAMGNEFRPQYFDNSSLKKAHSGTDRKGRSFDSISVKGGTCGVMNDEIIVWNTDAINLKYLCEFDR